MKAFAAALMLCLLSAPVHAVERTDRRIASIVAEAEALKAKGDAKGGLARVRDAMALAEEDPGPRSENLFKALDALSEHLPSADFELQFAVFDRLSAVASTARGADSYPALAALAGRNVLAFVLRKPGAGLPAFAEALGRATPLATSERDKGQMTGLAMILAQLYDATGQHAKAVDIVATVGKFYETMPSVPNSSFAPGLMSLALRYADWQDWPKAIDAADRSIIASVAFHRKRTTEVTSALRVRGNAFVALGQVADAEREFREAVALADQQPDLGVTTSALLNLARLYMTTGRDALAVPLLDRVAEMAIDGPPQSNTRMIALLDRYNVAMRADDRAGAVRFAALALADADARGFATSQNYVPILLAVANAAIRSNDLVAADAALAKAQILLPKVVSANSSRYADVMFARGRIALARGSYVTAASETRAAIARWGTTPGADPQQVASAGAMLTQSLGRLGDHAGAWRAGRTGADQMTRVLLDRAARGGLELLDPQSLTIFETAVDAAWVNRQH